MCRVIDVMAQMTVKVIDVLAFLGYRCPGSSQLGISMFQFARHLALSVTAIRYYHWD